MRAAVLDAARRGDNGLRICNFEQLAARAAGGFVRPIDSDTLLSAVRDALATTSLGELDEIKALPGMARAAAETLRKAWRAGIDLQARAGSHPRIASLALLEAAVAERLPAAMRRPGDIVVAAMNSIDLAPAIFGSGIDIRGLTELSPVWRPLLRRLAETMPMKWIAGPREVPAWLDGSAVVVVREPEKHPQVAVVSAATALHEAIDALRWARELIASNRAAPHDIAIASTATADYDDHFIALRADANLDLHFVHGTKAVTTRDGQAAAALADILVRGLSQNRLRRLSFLAGGVRSPFGSLPEGWTRILPQEAPLRSVERWKQFLSSVPAAAWPDGLDHSSDLLRALEPLSRGTEAAQEAGETFLSNRALSIWRKALLQNPHTAVDAAIEAFRIDDSLDACVSIAWMPAEALAASPRKFVRLLGLSSRGWPRQVTEDRLLSNHIVPTSELDPLPVSTADRRDFRTILLTTEAEVVLSRPRRDSEGRLLGKSPLLHDLGHETYLLRTGTPQHAMSETDRLLARPEEFALHVQAKSAATCWRDWSADAVTAHDGLVRGDHPAIMAILARTQSASSLRMLLRDPIGFVWKYGLGMRSSEIEEEPLVLDQRGFGDLVHGLLERAVRLVESRGGLIHADATALQSALNEVMPTLQTEWETGQAVPPAVIWHRTLAEASSLSHAALSHPDDPLDGQRSYAEVRFGSGKADADEGAPWDTRLPVDIPGTNLRIGGYIDRLDLSADGKHARVRDYKTGKPPKNEVELDGGKELQRCLYAFAVKALLGHDVVVDASLLYPRACLVLPMKSPDATLDALKGHLAAAREVLAHGRAVAGPDTSGEYNDLAFALPANAPKNYCRRKEVGIAAILGPATAVWEAP
jgi:hypothetical protein